MLMALLADWFAPPQHSFNQRWVSMPAAMSWDDYANEERQCRGRRSACRASAGWVEFQAHFNFAASAPAQ
jgi:hypothetical protein